MIPKRQIRISHGSWRGLNLQLDQKVQIMLQWLYIQRRLAHYGRAYLREQSPLVVQRPRPPDRPD